uniref:EF-hand domain-containing protein n=1 Tax=Meloidogyne incognita TaxID=6306 RepID=A0A914LL59_MELIC
MAERITSRKFLGYIILFAFIHYCIIPMIFAPPPPAKRQKIEEPQQQNENTVEGDYPDSFQFPYSKYLELVVKILESHPVFQEKLKGLSETEIKEGKIADHMDDLPQDVFDKLTEAKVEEIERIRADLEKQIEKDGDARNVVMPEHLDVSELKKFGKEDLRKLIKKTVADMEKIDEERKKEFKEYEMKKKAEEDHKLAQMTPEERNKAAKEIEEAKKHHNEHEELKHPGGREQLEEVWEERDHMDKNSFDPKTFFALHDLNSDGFLNEEEIEALFQFELEKVYNESDPADDPREKIEEMNRMREHVVAQMDKNGDRLISLDEFLHDTQVQAPEGQKDEGWKDLGDQKIYTDEELARFEKEYAQKQAGWGDHAYDQVVPEVHSPQADPQYGQLPPQQVPVHPPGQNQQQFNQEAQNIPPQHQQPSQKIDPVYGI